MHMLVYSDCRVIHSQPRSFHNLKKFFAISLIKYTPAVHKDIGSNILPGSANYRMIFSDFLAA